MYVDLTQQRSCNAQTIQYWIKDFPHLHQNDKDCLSNGTWLTDTLMDAGQSLLQKGFPQCRRSPANFIGENPAEINYIQNKLHEHFLNCLERRAISKFPQRERKKAARFNSQTSYGIYCICRLPKSEDMICCDSCQECMVS